MSDVPFNLTRMGRAYYESTLPRLVRELERLNTNLERLAEAVANPKGDSLDQDDNEEAHPPHPRAADR